MIFLFGVTLFAFILSFVFNPISDGIVSGGDFYQIQYEKNILESLFAWRNYVGQGGFNTIFPAWPYFTIVRWFIERGFSNNQIANGTIVFYIVGSYLSFYIGGLWLFGREKRRQIELSALFYACNNFLMNLFHYSWIYTHHFLIYIILPFFVFSGVSLVRDDGKWKRLLYPIVCILSFPLVNNVAFLIVFYLNLTIVLLVLVPLKEIKLRIGRIAYIYVLPLIVYLPYLVSFVLANTAFVGKIGNTNALGGDVINFIRNTSTHPYYLLQLSSTFYDLKNSWLTGLYMVILAYFIWKGKHRKILWTLTSVFVILILLNVRVGYPVHLLNTLLYTLPFMTLFRSPDKLLLSLPLIYALIIYYSAGRLSRLQKYIIALLIVVIPVKAYAGNIKQSLETVRNNSSYLARIPYEYYDIRSQVNSGYQNTTIISLPYSVVNSLNWSNYTKWNYIGQDILYMLYDKYYITANSYDHPFYETKLSFKDYVSDRKQPGDLIPLIRKYGGQYIIYHRDIHPDSEKDNIRMLTDLEMLVVNGDFQLVTKNDYFYLFEVSPKNISPIVSGVYNLKIRKLNPAHYSISFDINHEDELILRQSFNPEWKLYLRRTSDPIICQTWFPYADGSKECRDGQKFEFAEMLTSVNPEYTQGVHRLVDDYANSWILTEETVRKNFNQAYFSTTPEGQMHLEADLYFRPQSFFYLTYLYHGVIIITVIIISGVRYVKSKRQ
ncbi:hypothetical protein A2Z33_05510 [Candidatus Gottesmanbacteria bacterium RBG_16_52_11]|uniref:Membrane protein 6-pyruvoyl-tetrahydropterin synthase-related domain-containing protein n=1 Tax=Candidatus Gottesmanbacteria bacterium RBG_16_52_11 TaxID=1798374 RepID=A0A1F5YN97_9BACT|nr:MAG: hypothetical protein A2Z33_05510 [Candidatus Gottesmanbacteria bacterium RBG_16_52_11]